MNSFRKFALVSKLYNERTLSSVIAVFDISRDLIDFYFEQI
jgi:hypothetical protein